MNGSLILHVCFAMACMISCIMARNVVYFPGAVRGIYGYSYSGTANYNEYARQYKKPVVLAGGYRGGALRVSGGYRGGPLLAGGYRDLSPVDYYDDLVATHDYYGGGLYGRGYRSRGSGYPYSYNYY
ncbi:uncharacterized protein LOC111271451 isoform X2 [Varroa jacobsoni]|nr:uncharacterized protein LOC111271451 isoform X2 [Varroa jacobsoni]XP_022707985.1 uncharacterized protein LOC111271451 isoform X2 [Varroa jacobsoni]XP_022707986.1 uncharacterized protein LOC111271451 isoform X2 [Varroa jacobsoni]XP_022707987.1 uncharacterized protein LOC111271451 isoform X2 [Varroa jacobsoni]